MILKLQYGNLHIAEKKELKNNGRKVASDFKDKTNTYLNGDYQ